jgi:hypothetical protein
MYACHACVTYTCMYVRTYVCMYACTYACMYVRIYICIYVCTCIHINIRMHVCMHACIHRDVLTDRALSLRIVSRLVLQTFSSSLPSVNMYVCMHACMWIFPRLQTRTHTLPLSLRIFSRLALQTFSSSLRSLSSATDFFMAAFSWANFFSMSFSSLICPCVGAIKKNSACSSSR